MPTETSRPTIDPVTLTREEKLNLIYRHKPRDYKDRMNGVRTVLIYRHGTKLIDLDSMTDAEIADHLPYAITQEQKRLDRLHLKAIRAQFN